MPTNTPPMSTNKSGYVQSAAMSLLLPRIPLASSWEERLVSRRVPMGLGPKTPRIVEQNWRRLSFDVPSLTLIKRKAKRPFRNITHFTNGSHNCVCPGYYWAVQTRAWSRKCRHWKMTTVRAGADGVLEGFEEALKILTSKGTDAYVAWNLIGRCAFPVNYRMTELYCEDCPLYPHYCNIHPCYVKRHSKPLLWNIQREIYNGKKKNAARLLRKIIKIVKALKNGG